jgi:hypothetical protein
MVGRKVPDTYDFEFDARGEEEEDMWKSASVVYAEEIDGPDGAIQAFNVNEQACSNAIPSNPPTAHCSPSQRLNSNQ